MTRIKRIPIHELAWMAGVLDLKGRFVSKVNKSRATPQMTLYVETKLKPIVDRLSRLTGVSPDLKEAKPVSEFLRRGCDEHCPAPHRHVNVDKEGNELEMPRLTRWTITGAGIVVLVHNVADYLCSESKPIYLGNAQAIKLYTPISGQGSGAVVSSIRRLALLGWTLPEYYESVMEN